MAAWGASEDWLAAVMRYLDRNRRAVAEWAARADLGHHLPESTYLAWLDCRALGLGEDPAEGFLARGRVALSPGPGFGTQGRGFARLNMGTSPELMAEAVRRMAAAAAAQAHEPGGLTERVGS